MSVQSQYPIILEKSISFSKCTVILFVGPLGEGWEKGKQDEFFALWQGPSSSGFILPFIQGL